MSARAFEAGAYDSNLKRDRLGPLAATVRDLESYGSIDQHQATQALSVRLTSISPLHLTPLEFWFVDCCGV